MRTAKDGFRGTKDETANINVFEMGRIVGYRDY
jgi:hypothetical protein